MFNNYQFKTLKNSKLSLTPLWIASNVSVRPSVEPYSNWTVVLTVYLTNSSNLPLFAYIHMAADIWATRTVSSRQKYYK